MLSGFVRRSENPDGSGAGAGQLALGPADAEDGLIANTLTGGGSSGGSKTDAVGACRPGFAPFRRAAGVSPLRCRLAEAAGSAGLRAAALVAAPVAVLQTAAQSDRAVGAVAANSGAVGPGAGAAPASLVQQAMAGAAEGTVANAAGVALGKGDADAAPTVIAQLGAQAPGSGGSAGPLVNDAVVAGGGALVAQLAAVGTPLGRRREFLQSEALSLNLVLQPSEGGWGRGGAWGASSLPSWFGGGSSGIAREAGGINTPVT